MGPRYPNLYDADRWRRYGWALLLTGILAVAAGLFVAARSGQPAAANWMVVGATAVGLGTVFWLRQRFSYLQMDGGQLLCRVLLLSQRIDLGEVRRARVARLGAALERRPARSPRRWRDTEALVLRLRHPDDGRLRRLLSRRCVFEDEVVVPVANAASLQREIEAALAPRLSSAGAGPRVPARRRGRRR